MIWLEQALLLLRQQLLLLLSGSGGGGGGVERQLLAGETEAEGALEDWLESPADRSWNALVKLRALFRCTLLPLFSCRDVIRRCNSKRISLIVCTSFR